MWVPDWLVIFLGKEIKKEIQMVDSTTATVPWYQNKSTLAHIFSGLMTVVTAGIGIYTGDFGGHIPDALLKVGSFVLLIAQGVGIYDNHS